MRVALLQRRQRAKTFEPLFFKAALSGYLALKKSLAIALPVQHGDRTSQQRQPGLLSQIALIAFDLKSNTLMFFMINMPLGPFHARWALK